MANTAGDLQDGFLLIIESLIDYHLWNSLNLILNNIGLQPVEHLIPFCYQMFWRQCSLKLMGFSGEALFVRKCLAVACRRNRISAAWFCSTNHLILDSPDHQQQVALHRLSLVCWWLSHWASPAILRSFPKEIRLCREYDCMDKRPPKRPVKWKEF